MTEDRTTASRLDALPEPHRVAVIGEGERHLLPLPLDAPAFFTVTSQRPRLLTRRPREPLRSALVIGPRHLVIATDGSKHGMTVTTAALRDITAGTKAEMFRDPRLEAAAGDAELWILLGHERGLMPVALHPPDGPQVVVALREAIRRAKAAD